MDSIAAGFFLRNSRCLAIFQFLRREASTADGVCNRVKGTEKCQDQYFKTEPVRKDRSTEGAQRHAITPQTYVVALTRVSYTVKQNGRRRNMIEVYVLIRIPQVEGGQ